MLGRKKNNAEKTAQAEAEAAAARAEAQNTRRQPEKKGVPTPKRSQQQAARKRPLVQNDRKVARAAQRQQMADQRVKMRRAMETGEEKYLPPRDRGPQRRFVRDYVDARFGIGEWMLILVLVFLFASFVMNEEMRIIVSQILWLFVLAVLVEAVWVGRLVRKKVDAKFGVENRERGLPFYAAMRALQIRRLRLPKPQVARGHFPA
ncbi:MULTISPECIES: DUF3043 domain-containing protein [Nesterenkonia]|uniref:DUF3043 domain-containing protein n=2 Tax=Nesterenkonia TaxID=57494 RepID=A0A0W8IDT3_9MICC|nr:DUF3043 domain-containing protein [Nesterenkonia jeotgali]KUG58119.1 hypothetical protein AVL63_06480 [Nesterenkonia jeotgali]MBA8920916.1 hypothetical protein [Nesterenkonia jeotgali]NYJ17517.1 hypothetical protein [Nesterenkonia sandarakina]